MQQLAATRGDAPCAMLARLGTAAEVPGRRLGLPRHLHHGLRSGGVKIGKKPLSSTTPQTVIQIDLAHPYVHLHLLAAAAWPDSPSKRAEALATFASIALGQIEDLGPERADQFIDAHLAEAAANWGCTVEEIRALPDFPEMRAAWASSLLRNAQGSYRDEVLIPAGGIRTLGRAVGEQAVLDHLRAAVAPSINTVGRALLLTAAVHQHHPEIKASLNRSLTIIEATGIGRGKKVTFRTLMDRWKTQRSMAPLYAAQRLWLDRSLTEPNPRLIANLMFTALGSRTILAWAKWFLEWATKYSAVGSDSVVLPESEAVLLQADVPAWPPPLMRLTDEEWRAATGYRVRSNYQVLD